MKSQKPLSRKENIVIQEMDGEVLVYDLSDNRAVCLNEMSALIWQACDGKRTPAEISNFVSKKINNLVSEELVWIALDQLKAEKLLENGSELGNYFAGISRREVIRKIGLGSMVALPVIASLVAPAAISAQSCTGSGLASPGVNVMSTGASGGACAATLPALCCSGMINFGTRIISAPPAPFTCSADCA